MLGDGFTAASGIKQLPNGVLRREYNRLPDDGQRCTDCGAEKLIRCHVKLSGWICTDCYGKTHRASTSQAK